MNMMAFGLLALSILSLWLTAKKWIPLMLFIAATALASYCELLSPKGLGWIIAVGITTFFSLSPRFSAWFRTIGSLAFLSLITYSFLRIFRENGWIFLHQYTLSEHSAPFNFYLNFDKPAIGFFIILFSKHLWPKIDHPQKMVITTLKTIALCIAAILIPALAVHYVAFEPKVPDLVFWLWFINNLFLVCIIEEALYRQYIQGFLMRCCEKFKISWIFALVVASFIFGLAHFRGGPIYILLSTIAGLFYGYSYHQTKRLESSVAVHLSLNAVHFLFFTYPFLQRLPV